MARDPNIQATIEARSQEFAENFNNGDFTGLGMMLTEDAVLLPPGAQPANGREAVRNFFRQARRIRSLRCEPATIKPLGENVVTEAGTIRLVVGGGARAPGGTEVDGSYALVWEKVGDQWLLASLIWNRAAQPGAGQGRGRFPGQRQAGAGVDGSGPGGGPGGGGGRAQGGGAPGYGRPGGGYGGGGRGPNRGGPQRRPLVPRID
jgi:ketosteroid isomerase-like protein